MAGFRLLVWAAVISGAAGGNAFAQTCPHPITEQDVVAAQDVWGRSIVAIGAAASPRAVAEDVLDQLYGFGQGVVLFKPTKAAQNQFRLERGEALSYFVGGDLQEDHGFALAPYHKVRFENRAVVSDCDSAFAMGNYYFTDAHGGETKVEYTFGYFRGADGQVRINLHHSSLPYSAH